MKETFIPYGRQAVFQEEIDSVEAVLRSDWLTQGPLVPRFEQSVARYCGARYAVAVSSGTAALHLACLAAGFASGDEVITSPITFVATANAVLYVGATPVFADIVADTCCLDPLELVKRLTPATRGMIPVHFAGRPCDMLAINKIATDRGLVVIEDAAHALGASYRSDGEEFKVGSCSHSDMTIFSFHPVKHITTGEGGLITTNDEGLYRKLRSLRSHGIIRDSAETTNDEGPWYYEMQQLGFNYRITDLQCALGITQLGRLDSFVERRRKIARTYQEAFAGEDELILPREDVSVNSSVHLYVLQLRSLSRRLFFNRLRDRGLGVNVHYIPVHYQPYYKRLFGFCKGDFPESEAYYARAITIPLYPAMTDDDVSFVIATVLDILHELQQNASINQDEVAYDE